MSDRSFTAGDGSSSLSGQMYRRGPDGSVGLVDIDFGEYRHPPKGARGRFELHGWSPYYETQSTFEGVTKTVTRMRAEYRIVKLSGHPEFDGTLFSQQFPVPKDIANEKSKLGQFLRALLDRPFAKGEEVNPDDFIGTEFVTSVTRDDVGDKSYCGISWDTIDPPKTKLSPYVGGAKDPVGVAAAAAGENPFDGGFEGEDEDEL